MGHALGYQAVNKKMAGNLSFHGRYCAAVKGTWVQAPCKAGGSRRTRWMLKALNTSKPCIRASPSNTH